MSFKRGGIVRAIAIFWNNGSAFTEGVGAAIAQDAQRYMTILSAGNGEQRSREEITNTSLREAAPTTSLLRRRSVQVSTSAQCPIPNAQV
ncbi:hypothetical protein [Nostoc sp.]|uniref:hypothetical protein n=1 Tax=Nostoc sp. TaxID=1180 RepID=UPI002FF536FA